MYLDSAYIAKYYVNEPDAPAVRKLIRQATSFCSSAWTIIEVNCVFQRHIRKRSLTVAQGHELMDLFRDHVAADLWNLIPVTSAQLARTVALIRDLPAHVSIRAGDAVHLATALDAGERELYTNDRHLLAAAKQVGLEGKRVASEDGAN